MTIFLPVVAEVNPEHVAAFYALSSICDNLRRPNRKTRVEITEDGPVAVIGSDVFPGVEYKAWWRTCWTIDLGDRWESIGFGLDTDRRLISTLLLGEIIDYEETLPLFDPETVNARRDSEPLVLAPIAGGSPEEDSQAALLVAFQGDDFVARATRQYDAGEYLIGRSLASTIARRRTGGHDA